MRYVAIVLALAASSAQGQVKCTAADGSVSYQATPCATGEKTQHLTPAPTRKPVARAVADPVQGKICRSMLHASLKDPESARYGAEPYVAGTVESEGRTFIHWVDGVNARNSYGGYTGVQAYSCYFRADTGAWAGLQRGER